MDSRKKRSWPGMQVGSSYLLVIFILLCLIIFAALSFSSALRDYGYSQKASQKTTAYYEACSKAYEKLAEIDEALQDGGDGLSQIADITIDGGIITYEIDMNDSQALQVTLEVDGTDSSYKITSWKETAKNSWKPDTSLPLLEIDESGN